MIVFQVIVTLTHAAHLLVGYVHLGEYFLQLTVTFLDPCRFVPKDEVDTVSSGTLHWTGAIVCNMFPTSFEMMNHLGWMPPQTDFLVT
jgi:hypothetical protein